MEEEVDLFEVLERAVSAQDIQGRWWVRAGVAPTFEWRFPHCRRRSTEELLHTRITTFAVPFELPLALALDPTTDKQALRVRPPRNLTVGLSRVLRRADWVVDIDGRRWDRNYDSWLSPRCATRSTAGIQRAGVRSITFSFEASLVKALRGTK